jgi:hypothetical protein
MSNMFDLAKLPSKVLMAMATVLEERNLMTTTARTVDEIYEEIYEVLGDRGENRFCGKHLSVLIAPDYCQQCWDDENPTATVRPPTRLYSPRNEISDRFEPR